MSQYEPMREVSREELLAELNKIALRPIKPDWNQLGHAANAEAYARHAATRCSPKVTDIKASDGRVCPKAFGGKVTLEVESSCCEPNNGKFEIKDGGKWKDLDGMKGVEFNDDHKGDHGDGPEHKEVTIDLGKFPYDIADGDWDIKWTGKCDQKPGSFESEATIKQSNNCEDCPDFRMVIDECTAECKKGNKVKLKASASGVKDSDVQFSWFKGNPGDDIKVGTGAEFSYTCGKDTDDNSATQKHKLTVVGVFKSDTCDQQRNTKSCEMKVKGEDSNTGGDSDSHCTDFEDTGGCKTFRWDCTTSNARFCEGDKGKVKLKASTHACNSGDCPGSELSYQWYESSSKNSGWKEVSGGTGSTLEAKPPSNLESGDKYYYKCKATCKDFPGGSVTIEGGGDNGGKDVVTVSIVDCCDGDQPCQKGKQCCNKKDHPDQPEGCRECCKNKHCSDGKVCENGKCVEPDKEPDPEPTDECTKDGDCTKGNKKKCCKVNGKMVCRECCKKGDCPDGHKCEDGVCVEEDDDGDGDDDPCKDVECPEGEICEDGKCVEDPDYDPCADVECEGASKCVDGECVCDDPNAWYSDDLELCICDNGYEWDEDKEECVPNGESKPPPGEDPCGDMEDPCWGVICTPPQECDKETGKCVCPDGKELINGLCLDPDKCNGVLCPPNSTCEDGVCVCDDGYVADEKGNCVMSETEGCDPPEDCCPANSTICVQAGSGLGGGGCFTLNQDCDKTIMLWVDPNGDGADDNCDDTGLQQICSCTKEIQALTDMITSLTARIAELEAHQGSVDGEITEGGYYQYGAWDARKQDQ